MTTWFIRDSLDLSSDIIGVKKDLLILFVVSWLPFVHFINEMKTMGKENSLLSLSDRNANGLIGRKGSFIQSLLPSQIS